MAETIKARKGFEDYYNLGPGRSLDLLIEEYEKLPKGKAPTLRRATLGTWSVKYRWQERVIQRDAEVALAQFEEIKAKAKETGYANDFMRIWDLGKIAEKLKAEIEAGKIWLNDVKSIGQGKDAERVDIVRFNEGLLRQFDHYLDSIAKEMGGRQKNVNFSDAGGQAFEEHRQRYDQLVDDVYGLPAEGSSDDL